MRILHCRGTFLCSIANALQTPGLDRLITPKSPRPMTRSVAFLSGFLLLAPLGSAQESGLGSRPSINIDVGIGGFALAPDTYGAAGPAGPWNLFDVAVLEAAGPVFNSGLLFDTTGAVSSVSCVWDTFGTQLMRWFSANPLTVGDDELLLDDSVWAGVNDTQVRFEGLPPGPYQVYVYSVGINDGNRIEVLGSPDPVQAIGDNFSAGFVAGSTHSSHVVAVGDDGRLTIDILPDPIENICGFQIFPVAELPEVGMSDCGPAVPNSSGGPASIAAFGSDAVPSNVLELCTTGMPTNVFGFCLASTTDAFVQQPGGSLGNLCLGGVIGRFVGAGQVMDSGVSGAFCLDVDVTRLPQPTSNVAAMPGETWRFQTWFRDSVAGNATSNFSDSVAITFE